MRRKHYEQIMFNENIPREYRMFIENQYNQQLKYGLVDSMPFEQVKWRINTAYEQQLYVSIIYRDVNIVDDVVGTIFEMDSSVCKVKAEDRKVSILSTQILDIQEAQ